MYINKNFFSRKKGGANALIAVALAGILIGTAPHFSFQPEIANADLTKTASENASGEDVNSRLPIFQGNTLAHSGPLPEIGKKLILPAIKVKGSMAVLATAYSSTVDQTDSTPFITAAGTQVRNGIIANNGLAFGTKVRIPDLFGEQIFVVEDRMNAKKDGSHIDIWFPSREEALQFGKQRTIIEIVGL